MEHPLQILDTAANVAVAGEIERPQLTAHAVGAAQERALKVIGGFAVHDADAEERARADFLTRRREKALQYQADRKTLEGELSKRGVTPLGFAPAGAWDYLCQRSGLYRLRFDRDSQILVKNPVVATTPGLWAVPVWLLSLTVSVTVLLGFVLAYNALSVLPGYLWLLSAPVAVMGVLVCLVAAVSHIHPEAAAEMTLDHYQVLERMIFRFKLGRMSHEDRLRLVMPQQYTYYDRHDGRQLTAVTVALPDAPADVQEQLVRIADMHDLETVAVPEAIAFVPPLPQQLGRALRQSQGELQDALRLERLRLHADPIVTVRLGTAVALVAQFGDFPIEEAVMHEALTTEHLFA